MLNMHCFSNSLNDPVRGKGQSERLERQQVLSGGPAGIFGKAAKKHDLFIRHVMEFVFIELKTRYKEFDFRHRMEISKKEINQNLGKINNSLGQVLFVRKAKIKPDGGIIEVLDKNGHYRIVLIGESKHQGNDVEKIKSGIKQGKNKDADLIVAGNAIERVHKNIQEFKNLMLNEYHFPYVVFLQGSNFATKTFFVNAPDGREVCISDEAGSLNRIDRVTASNFGMKINQNYCRNKFVQLNNKLQILQAASLYFQCDPWDASDMEEILLEVAITSLDILAKSLPGGNYD